MPCCEKILRRLCRFGAVTRLLCGTREAEERRGPSRGPHERCLKLHDGSGRITGAEKGFRIELRRRLDRVRPRDRPGPLRFERRCARERRERAGAVAA